MGSIVRDPTLPPEIGRRNGPGRGPTDGLRGTRLCSEKGMKALERMAGKQTILIVDDSEMNRAILADMLGNEFDILEAENGSEGVEMLQKYGAEISLVLLDIVMPVMDGFGVLEVMNSHGWIKDIPVIMVSAESDPAYIERAYELGVTDFINRPYDVIYLIQRSLCITYTAVKLKRFLPSICVNQTDLAASC